MSQRTALLTLYNGLTFAGPRADERASLLEAIGPAGAATFPPGPLTADTIANQGFASGPFADQFEELAVTGAKPLSTTGVLAIERLEFLLELSRSLQARPSDSSLREVMLSDPDPGLSALVHGLIAPNFRTDSVAVDLAGEIDSAARDYAPPMIFLEPDQDPSDDRQLAATVVVQEFRSRLTVELQKQPSTTCVGSLNGVLYEPQNPDGRSELEYAVGLDTSTVYPRDCVVSIVDEDGNVEEARPFEDLTVSDFVDALFSPSAWTECHDFWCEMIEVTSASDPPGLPADVDWDMLKSQCEGTLIWEKVGDCAAGDSDWFQYTILCFKVEYVEDGEALMSYTQMTDPAAFAGEPPALLIDNGAIEIVDGPDGVEVNISKTLQFRALNGVVEGHVLAEFACQTGWVDNTRALIHNCLVRALTAIAGSQDSVSRRRSDVSTLRTNSD